MLVLSKGTLDTRDGDVIENRTLGRSRSLQRVRESAFYSCERERTELRDEILKSREIRDSTDILRITLALEESGSRGDEHFASESEGEAEKRDEKGLTCTFL